MKIKKDLTGILIISVPGPRPFKTNYIRKKYDQIFTVDEKKRFEFITLDYDFPHALSTKTLSLFYNNSKVHLNLHPKERHGRAQAYALASCLPIVGFKNLTYLVNKKFRKEPYYFITADLKSFPKKLVKAINYVDSNYKIEKHKKLRKTFNSKSSYLKLKKILFEKFRLNDENWNFQDDWDIRLAKHHLGFSGKNSYFQTIDEFLDKINEPVTLRFRDEIEDDNNILAKKNILNIKTRHLFYYARNYFNKFKILIKNILRKIKYKL